MRRTTLLKTFLLLCALVAGNGTAWAEDSYTELFKIHSGDVINGTTYGKYTKTVEDRDFIITFGGNNASVGTNSNNRSNCTLADQSKYAVSPVNTSSIASAFACTTRISDVSKISYTFSGGSNQTSTNVYLLYSPDNITYSQILLTSGTQGATISSGTAYTFNVATGYFALLFEATNTSGNWRIDGVEITFYKKDIRVPVNLTSFTAANTTLFVGATQATAVANDQEDWTAAYKYTSENTNVATISDDGVITAVGKGTTKVWAELNIAEDDADYKLGTTIKKSIDIAVVKPAHQVLFSVNGVDTDPISVEEDEVITFPTDVPTTLGGKDFVGWTSSVIAGSQSGAPEPLITTATTPMGNADITYYAVYATGCQTIASVTDVLTRATTGITGTNYDSWEGKTSNSNAFYAGNSAGSNESIQLRSNNNNSGIITTVSGGKAKKITVVWNSNTANGRTLNVYGKNEAYSAVSELYNSTNQGKLLGTIVNGTSTELTIASDYEYIGLRSASGAMYLTSISIEWEGETTGHNGYCTTIPAPTAVVSAAGWATWNAPCAVSFPEGLNAYLVKVNSDPAKVSLIEVSDVPANTPVLLEASAGTYTMDMIESSTTSTEGNLLHVSTGTNIENTMYVLAKIDNVVGFYMWDKTKGGDLPEGKIYLEMPSGGVRPFIALPGEETGISDMNRETVTNNRYFDLQGRRVAQPTKGMYIVNGKKVVVK